MSSIYRNALAVQSASNLPGIVSQFAEDLDQILAEVRSAGGGTNQVNTHPVARLYAEQIAWLSGAGSCANHRCYLRAQDECKRRANEPQSIPEDEDDSVS
jgi:hypothetical protein